MLRLIFLFLLTASPTASSVWDGVYTEEQATRGKDMYDKRCAGCHELSQFSGKTFMDRWNKKPTADLFDLISKDMPMDAPGDLKKNEYADITAYMFKVNAFPAGAKELPGDSAALKEIIIEPKK